MSAGRPALERGLDEAEFRRWYWTLAELRAFARDLGVGASGAKAEVADRIAAALGGRSAARNARSPARASSTLPGPLTQQTLLPAGQSATQQLRAYFLEVIGPSFIFDGHMRRFLTQSEGATLGDAVENWHRTRGTELPPQSSSLEFNRFTRHWHRDHPEGSAADSRAAWKRYRALPVDERPDVADA